MLDFRGKAGQLGVCAEVLAEATDVFNRNENTVSLGVVQLKVFRSGAIIRLQHPSTNVSADAVSGMDNQFAGLKWRGELS